MTETVVFGGGCFWCTEAVFSMLKGVQSVEPGYAGPSTSSGHAPTYEQVSTGKTPYVESARVVYNPDDIAFPELLQVYFGSHDATQTDGQGNDIGPQYRSAVFYTTERQKQMTEHYIQVLGKGSVKPVATSVEPLQQFYVAEDYHKQYFAKNPHAGYCQLVIAPKIEKIRATYKSLLQ